MSRVKSKDTSLEKLIQKELTKTGLRFQKHVSTLPGRPDIVLHSAKLAVFVDGDFWHGYRFPMWRKQLSEFWQHKISETRRRDFRNFSKLRRCGWDVIRIWQHQVESDLALCVSKVVAKYRISVRCQRAKQRKV